MKLDRWMTIMWTIAICGIGGCRPVSKPQASPTPAAIEAKLELDNLSFEQVDKQGKPWWKSSGTTWYLCSR